MTAKVSRATNSEENWLWLPVLTSLLPEVMEPVDGFAEESTAVEAPVTALVDETPVTAPVDAESVPETADVDVEDETEVDAAEVELEDEVEVEPLGAEVELVTAADVTVDVLAAVTAKQVSQ